MRKWLVVIALVMMVVALVFALKQYAGTEDAWSKVAPASDYKTFERVVEYRKMGDFERAVALAIEPVNGKQPDDFLLQATSVTYFQRALADSGNKEKWVELAVQYSNRALDANPKSLVNIFNVGDSYMSAGMNLGKPRGCPYYERSLQTFDRLKADPALNGEWGVIDGERVRLKPYRQKLDEHMKNLQLVAARCPGFPQSAR